MKKVLCALLMCMMVVGCGTAERLYDQENYESLTNETGTISLYSGGVLIDTFENAKVKYASSDSEAIWFIDASGEEKYWQGSLKMDIY